MFEDFYLKVQLLSKDALPPTRGTFWSAGLDLYLPKDVLVEPHSDVLIPLDIRVEFPKGYVMLLKEKSGIAIDKKLSVAAGVIDADYRGSIHLHYFNYTKNTAFLKKHSKVIQALIVPVWLGNIQVVKKISTKTERGEGGFGSTDKKI